MPDIYRGDNLTGRIEIDGKRFERCVFTSAVLVYAGGEPPVMTGCTLNSCRIEFAGPAGTTLAFMRAMYHGGFAKDLEAAFEQIRAPGDSPWPNASGATPAGSD